VSLSPAIICSLMHAPDSMWLHHQAETSCAQPAAPDSLSNGCRCASSCRELNGKGIAGTLPPGLAAMDQLQLLDLGGNAFGGVLPAAWGAPAAFPLLVSLDLKGNALTGGQI
jgi:hypothetical protein